MGSVHSIVLNDSCIFPWLKEHNCVVPNQKIITEATWIMRGNR